MNKDPKRLYYTDGLYGKELNWGSGKWIIKGIESIPEGVNGTIEELLPGSSMLMEYYINDEKEKSSHKILYDPDFSDWNKLHETLPDNKYVRLLIWIAVQESLHGSKDFSNVIFKQNNGVGHDSYKDYKVEYNSNKFFLINNNTRNEININQDYKYKFTKSVGAAPPQTNVKMYVMDPTEMSKAGPSKLLEVKKATTEKVLPVSTKEISTCGECGDTKISGYKFCDVHLCNHNNNGRCKSKVKSDPKYSYYQKYCYDHQCPAPGCNNNKNRNKLFCTDAGHNDKMIEIAKKKTDNLDLALAQYTYNYLHSNKENVGKWYKNPGIMSYIRKNTFLVLPTNLDDKIKGVDGINIINHLKYRHLVYYGRPQTGYTRGFVAVPKVAVPKGDDCYELKSTSEVTAMRTELKKAIKKDIAKLRYGILGWTPVKTHQRSPLFYTNENIPRQSSWLTVGSVKGAWILHTWGVNMSEVYDDDGRYVFNSDTPPLLSENIRAQFNADALIRYKDLLNLMFEVIDNAIKKLNEVSNKHVLLRITGLGMGVWLTNVPANYKPQIKEYYYKKLYELLNDKTYLEIRHPNFPYRTTLRVKMDENIGNWEIVEGNHDPFGDIVIPPPKTEPTTIIYGPFQSANTGELPPEYETLIVNAWDNGSWIGNGGSEDNTMDGWTVAGGGGQRVKPDNTQIPLFFNADNIDKSNQLGFQFQNASYLHNVFFNPDLLDTTKWVRYP
jgi:hypothetical protein